MAIIIAVLIIFFRKKQWISKREYYDIEKDIKKGKKEKRIIQLISLTRYSITPSFIQLMNLSDKSLKITIKKQILTHINKK